MKGDVRWRSFWDAGNILFSHLGGVSMDMFTFWLVTNYTFLEFVHFYLSFALIKKAKLM